MVECFCKVVNDVREHFRTASETIASHNANFVKQVREEYQVRSGRAMSSPGLQDLECARSLPRPEVELSNSAKLREEACQCVPRHADLLRSFRGGI